MEVTVLVSPALAAALKGPMLRSSPDPLAAVLGQWRSGLRPLDPGSPDPTLSRYFVVDIPDPALAEAMRERLSRLPEVEAAYIKAMDALP